MIFERDEGALEARKEAPREFQSKIFRNALKQNTVLCAPTGCGKTRVAVMLIEHLLGKEELYTKRIERKRRQLYNTKKKFLKEEITKKKAEIKNIGTLKSLFEKRKREIKREVEREVPKKKPKIIFFVVHKVILVHQQYEYVKKFFDENTNQIQPVLSKSSESRRLGIKKFTIGKFYGEMGIDFWSKDKWRYHFKTNRVIVITAQILLNCLTTGFISLDNIELLIFDECHHCIKNSPYNRIMKEFYFPKKYAKVYQKINKIKPVKVKKIGKPNNDEEEDDEEEEEEGTDEEEEGEEGEDKDHLFMEKQKRQYAHEEGLPMIFGMTASPYTFSINKLKAEPTLNETKLAIIQNNLDCKVEIIDFKEALEFFSTPDLKMIPFDPERNEEEANEANIIVKRIKQYEELHKKMIKYSEYKLSYIRQFLLNLKFVLDDVGKRGFMMYLNDAKEKNKLTLLNQFSDTLSKEEKLFRTKVCYDFLNNKNLQFEEDSIPKPNEVSHKIKKLVEVLRGYSESYTKKKQEEIETGKFIPNKEKGEVNEEEDIEFCGIVFVERRISSFIVEKIIDSFKIPHIRVKSLFGHGVRKSNQLTSMRSKEQSNIMKNFGSNKKYNLLISTNVAEEGIDIQACNVVIRYDLFLDLRSYIQSRGRARDFSSDYIILYNVKDINHVSLTSDIKKCEDVMIETCKKGTNKLAKSNSQKEIEESIVIKETGAKVSLSGSISLINNICSLLPKDDFFNPIPVFEIIQSSFGYMSELKLPTNSPIKKTIFGKVQRSKRLAKESAALEGIRQLLKIGYLTHNLVPYEKIQQKKRQAKYGHSRIPRRYQIEHSGYINQNWFNLRPFETINCYLYQFQNVNELHNFKYGIITNKKFHSDCIPPLGIYFYENKLDEYKLKFLSTVEISRERLTLLKKFHDFIFSDLFNMKKTDPKNDSKYYLIVPIKHNAKQIDWKLTVQVELSQKEPKLLSNYINTKKGKENLHSLVIRTTYNLKYSHRWNIYEVLGSSTVKPTDKIPEVEEYNTYQDFYEKKHFFENIDLSQNMICGRHLLKYTDITKKRRKKRHEELYLLPQFCEILPLSLIEYLEATKIVVFFQYLEQSLKIVEWSSMFFNEKELTERVFKFMKEAFTIPQANKFFNYERLEFLGDCLLKWIASEFAFFQNPNHHEGLLHDERCLVVCNNNLFDLFLEKNCIQRFVLFEKLNDSRRIYRPPGYSVRKELKLSSKQIADMYESIMGGMFLAGGFTKVFKFLKWSNLQSLNVGFNYRQPTVSEKHMHLFQVFKLSKIEEIIGYTFKNKGLLIEAMCHPSFTHIESYQRLEYLGDAVIDFITTEKIFHDEKYGNLRLAGKLSLLRQQFVANNSFSVYIIEKKIYKYIIHASPRLNQVIHSFDIGACTVDEAPKLFGDLFESITGAVYIDSNYSLDLVKKIFLDTIFSIKIPEVIQNSVLSEPLEFILNKFLQKREKELLKDRYNFDKKKKKTEGKGEKEEGEEQDDDDDEEEEEEGENEYNSDEEDYMKKHKIFPNAKIVNPSSEVDNYFKRPRVHIEIKGGLIFESLEGGTEEAISEIEEKLKSKEQEKRMKLKKKHQNNPDHINNKSLLPNETEDLPKIKKPLDPKAKIQFKPIESEEKKRKLLEIINKYKNIKVED